MSESFNVDMSCLNSHYLVTYTITGLNIRGISNKKQLLKNDSCSFTFGVSFTFTFGVLFISLEIFFPSQPFDYVKHC